VSNNTLAKTRCLRGWFNQRYRKSLSYPALNSLLPRQSGQSNRFQADESTSSTHICRKAVAFRRPISPPSAFSQPLNAHRTSSVERFSPIHF